MVLAAAKAEPEINGVHCYPGGERRTILSTFHFSSCLLLFSCEGRLFFPAVIENDGGECTLCFEEKMINKAERSVLNVGLCGADGALHEPVDSDPLHNNSVRSSQAQF